MNLPPFTISCILLSAVLLFDSIVQIPDKYHPISFFRIFIERLSKKVNPSDGRSAYQQNISGCIALVASVFPLLLIALLFVPLTEFPWFFEGCLLFLSLGLQPCLRDIKKVQLALSKQQKILARDRLQDWLLRKTENLSEIGIAKASCETLILRNIYFYQAIIFFFLIAGSKGAYFAFTLRLVLELNQAWNCKKKQFQHFGQAAAFIHKLMLWLPSRLAAISFSLAGQWRQSINIIRKNKKTWASTNALWPLSFASSALKIKLGGPVIYEQDKIRRGHLEQDCQPNDQSIAHAITLIRQSNLIFFLLIIVTNIVMFVKPLSI